SVSRSPDATALCCSAGVTPVRCPAFHAAADPETTSIKGIKETVMKTGKILLVPALLAVVVTTGCATKKYVQAQDKVVTDRVEGVEAQVEQSQTRLTEHQATLDQHGNRLDKQEQQ